MEALDSLPPELRLSRCALERQQSPGGIPGISLNDPQKVRVRVEPVPDRPAPPVSSPTALSRNDGQV
jgi:hypothetical protein